MEGTERAGEAQSRSALRTHLVCFVNGRKWGEEAVAYGLEQRTLSESKLPKGYVFLTFYLEESLVVKGAQRSVYTRL